MTVPNSTCRVSYTGTASTATYPFTFLLFAAADLVVQTQATTTSAPVTLTLTTDYAVTGVGSYSGGTIVLTAGNLPTGVVISIFRDPAQVQSLLLQEQTAYNAQAVMGALDDLTMMVTALQDQVTRSIQMDPLDPTTPTSGVPGPPYSTNILPPQASMLGNFLYCDPGTGKYVGAGGGILPVGPYLLLSGGTVTGVVNGLTATTSDNTTKFATTAYVQANLAAQSGTIAATYAPLASPALTGVPTAPTAAPGTNTTQIATTAFVGAAVTAAIGVVTGYAILVDQKTNGTSGGTSAIGAYQQRDLNTSRINTMTGSVALGTNQFTLQAGTYRIKVSAPAGGTGIHQCKLTNVTDSTLTVGTSEFSAQVSSAIVAQTRSTVTTQLTLAGAKVFQVDHYTAAGIAAGLGAASSTGNPETYTVVEISRVA